MYVAVMFVVTRRVWLDIHVLGLRNLKKIGMLNIYKPFVRFDLAAESYGTRVQTGVPFEISLFFSSFLPEMIV